eukprot:CAMPEP_0170737910 /NCGR_PEP_ID=MMETSP0437-20130122/4375_1 /TAXON_ID=0 /ORGANISM="Sexangularia sp." /LENGTH=322 /DNA_ID=CAMNT_0011076321 /DNA_START=54 /DNA_END=1019 /DNA_ORIENTATION=+
MSPPSSNPVSHFSTLPISVHPSSLSTNPDPPLGDAPVGLHDWSKGRADLATSLSLSPSFTSTGTTIVGVTVPSAGAIVLGADTRSTSGDEVANKNCFKLHEMYPGHIFAGGAGTAADNDFMGDQVAAVLMQYARGEGRQPRVVHAVKTLVEKLFPYQGHIGANMIIGGVDETGPSLYAVAPHGSVSQVKFIADGSGLFGALSVLEAGWRENITLAEAQTLVQRAISAGIRHDQYSGSNVDMVSIIPTRPVPTAANASAGALARPLARAEMARSVVPGFERGVERAGGRNAPNGSVGPGYRFAQGDTKVVATKTRSFARIPMV